MKIEITNEGEYYHLYKQHEKRPLVNMRQNINTFAFYDDDIENIIGEKAFNGSFKNGKYIFEVSVNHLDLITGKRSARTRNELLMYKD